MNRNLREKKIVSPFLSYLHALSMANVSTKTLKCGRADETLIYRGIMETGNGVGWCIHIKNENPRSSTQL